jgi:glycosyltransferase involved in cell wall biosynthesis
MILQIRLASSHGAIESKFPSASQGKRFLTKSSRHLQAGSNQRSDSVGDRKEYNRNCCADALPATDSTMESPPSPSLSVIVPAFNEQALIRKAALECLEDLRAAGLDDYELILVDDGSSDGTNAEMKKLAEQYSKVRVLRHKRNRGLGASIRTGLQAATGEFLAWIPGDAQFRLAPLLEALPLMENCDFVVGLRGARRPKEIIRRCISWCLHLFTRWMFSADATDYCGLYILRRRDLPRLVGKSDNVFFNMEMLLNARKSRMMIKTISTPSLPRVAGSSKIINIRTIARNTRDMFRYRFLS